MPLRLAYKMCHCCFRGFPYKTRKTIIWSAKINGTNEIVNKWTCPNCQSAVRLIELSGRPITATRYAALQAMAT